MDPPFGLVGVAVVVVSTPLFVVLLPEPLPALPPEAEATVGVIDAGLDMVPVSFTGSTGCPS